MKTTLNRPRPVSSLTKALLFASACTFAGVGVAYAKGGTAKPPTTPPPPPAGAVGCPTFAPSTSACIVPAAGPVLPNFPPAAGGISGNLSNQFAITGYIQNVTETSGCTAGSNAGGTVTVNNIVITIPTDMIVQYPANTLTWTDAVCGVNAVQPPIALDGTGGTAPALHPGVEISVDGNLVAPAGAAASATSPHIAALVHISQQSLNSGSGYISGINYATGALIVGTAAGPVTLVINDPKGRYGRAQSSTDARFSVDDANPTIKAAASGYPMCVPRAVPGAPGQPETDPQCPQKNRPNIAPCRNFGAANVAFRVAGADLATTLAPNGYCAGFVMKAIAGMPGTLNLRPTDLVGSAPLMGSYGDPDPREMVPFQAGDFITWSGTLVRGTAAAAGVAATPDRIWVHTIDANVGAYTQPATLPAYIAIGGNGIGVNPEPRTAVALAGVEATPRIFMEANTSDIASIVDIYLDDKGFTLPAAAAPAGPLVPAANSEYFRWITPESMTGTLADQATQPGRGVAVPASAINQAGAFGGGIYTQFIGPQPGRARIRANKVPAIDATQACPATAATIGGTRGCAVTQSPTRYIRAVLRSLCAPAATGKASEPGFAALAAVPAKNLDNGATASTTPNAGPFFDINGTRTNLPGAATAGVYDGGANNGTAVGKQAANTCLESAQYANGLFTGQYMAPVGEYIFPENTLAGAPIVPNNFWHLGFLAYGESGRDGNSTAPQVPRPW